MILRNNTFVRYTRPYNQNLEQKQLAIQYLSSSMRHQQHQLKQHQKLKFKQFKDLMEIEDRLNMMYDEVVEIFNSRKFERVSLVLAQREEIITFISEKINAQIDRTRSEESSPKNTTLYFNILLETKDLVNNILNLLEEYHSSFRK